MVKQTEIGRGQYSKVVWTTWPSWYEGDLFDAIKFWFWCASFGFMGISSYK